MNDRFGTRVSKILCMDIFFVGVSIFLTHPYVYAIDSYNSESIFLSVAPIVKTEIFDNLPANYGDGFFNASFYGIVYEGEGKIGHTTCSISTLPYQPFGIPTSSAVLYSPAVGEDFFSFGSNHYVEAFAFDLFHPYDEQTVGGIINIDVTEIDGNISTFSHNQDGQWFYFGFISDVGMSQIRVYNLIEDNVLDTNFAFDNISRGEIVPFPEPVAIDIMPWRDPNYLFNTKMGRVFPSFLPVAVLSDKDFIAPDQVGRTSLTFGRTGLEYSLKRCAKRAMDVNHDGFKDLICYFRPNECGYQVGNNEGILNGQTMDGMPIDGLDWVNLIEWPWRWREERKH